MTRWRPPAPVRGPGRLAQVFALALTVGLACPPAPAGLPVQIADSADATQPHHPPASSSPAFPLHVSNSGRYLQDNNGNPFLVIGDSPQTLVSNLSLMQAADYMENRKHYGINTLWINALCNWPLICREDAATRDDIAPFLTKDDLSTWNPAYFNRVADAIGLARDNGMVVFLDPIETSGWLTVLRANGVAKAHAYGRFLGSRFKDFPNIVWMNGNDFQTWRNKADDALVLAVARGIREADPVHLQTIELDYFTSGSLDDPAWAQLIDLDAAYSYFPTYAQVLDEYDRRQFKPVFLVEGAYEFEHLPRTDGGAPLNLRKQEYWTMLSGATGVLYGSAATWQLEPGWRERLDSPGAAQLLYLRNLFAARRWYDLVPDSAHMVVTSGYGATSRLAGYFPWLVAHGSAGLRIRLFDFVKRHTGWGSVTANDYTTVAATKDGALALAYLPSIRTITVDMSRLRGPVNARWYDPAAGVYHAVAGTPFENKGEREFLPPSPNAAGDGDWVLVLEQQAGS